MAHGMCVLLGALALIVLVAHEERAGVGGRAKALALAPWLCFALLLTSYLTRGHIFPGDGSSHQGRTWLTFDAIAHGELPVWSNRWYMGYPLDLYYGPLCYWLAVLVVAVFAGKLFFATKVFLWTLHLGSAFAPIGSGSPWRCRS